MSRLGFDMVSDSPSTRMRRNRGALVVVVVGALVVMLGVVLVLRSVFSSDDYDGDGTGSVAVTVTEGETLSQIATALADAGVVKSARAFLAAAEGDDRASSLAPGEYRLRSQMSGAAALALMLDPSARPGSRVVVPEGLTVAETVAVLSKATGIPAATFRAVLARPDSYGLPDMAHGKPEGYLFPATYDITPQTDAVRLLSAMTRRFGQAAAKLDLEQRAADMGLTSAQVVTVASILQQEAAPPDYAKVSRSIYNRIAAGMRLQLDSTVAYALGVRKLALTAEQLRTASPYNTYLHDGLPPGPINSPGELALEAALSPASGHWLYWVTTDPKAGITKFTADYQQFLEYKREYLANTAG